MTDNFVDDAHDQGSSIKFDLSVAPSKEGKPSDGHHDDHGEVHSHGLQMIAPPIQRQKWGDTQVGDISRVLFNFDYITSTRHSANLVSHLAYPIIRFCLM